MAKLVFVHGVATRPGRDLDIAMQNMKLLLGTNVFRDVAFDFITPLWGDLVPTIPPDVFATNEATEAFSLGIAAEDTSDEAGIGVGPIAGATEGATIGGYAAAHPQLAIDAVLTNLVETADREGRALTAGDLALFSRAVDAVEGRDPAARLVAGSTDDDALADALDDDGEGFGISLSPVRKAIASVTDRIRNVTSGLAYGLVRGSIRPAVGLFSGDVFAYLANGALREEIRARIRAAIATAWKTRADGEALVIVGHSMGGVILIDMLADLAGSDLPRDLAVDCLFTVGSQPSLFQAVGALAGGAPAKAAKIPAPACIGTWFNAFDPIDPLAFQAEPIFDRVSDLAFDSITGVASAHTTYFRRPQFYARLRSRLDGLKLIR